MNWQEIPRRNYREWNLALPGGRVVKVLDLGDQVQAVTREGFVKVVDG